MEKINLADIICFWAAMLTDDIKDCPFLIYSYHLNKEVVIMNSPQQTAGFAQGMLNYTFSTLNSIWLSYTPAIERVAV